MTRLVLGYVGWMDTAFDATARQRRRYKRMFDEMEELGTRCALNWDSKMITSSIKPTALPR